MSRGLTSIRQVGPVDDSVSLQVSIEGLLGEGEPGQRDDLWRLGGGQDILRGPRGHCQWTGEDGRG